MRLILFLLLLPAIAWAQDFPVPPQWDGTDLKIETPEVYLTIRKVPDGEGTAYVFAVRTRGALELEDIFTNTTGEKISFVIAPQVDGKSRHLVGVFPVGDTGRVQLVEIQTPGEPATP